MKLSKTVRDIMKMLMSSLGAQLVFLACLPYVTRQVPPEVFGKFSALMSYSTIFAFSAALHYENAFFQNRSVIARVNTVGLTLLVCALNAIVGTALFTTVFADYLGLSASDGVFVFAIILGQALALTFIAYNISQGAYTTVSLTRFLRAVVNVLIWFTGLWLLSGSQAIVLYAGAAGAAWFAALSLSRSGLKQLRSTPGALSLARIKKTAFAYRRYPVFQAPSRMLTLISQNSLVILTAALFSTEMAGLIGLASLGVTKPLGVVLQSLGRVSQERYARALRNRDAASVKRVVRKTFLLLVLISLVLGLVMALAAEPLTRLAFGAGWLALPAILITFVPRLIAIVIVRPMQLLMAVRGNQAMILAQETAGMTVSIGSFLAGYLLFDSIHTVLWISSGATCVLYLLYSLWIWRNLQTVPAAAQRSAA